MAFNVVHITSFLTSLSVYLSLASSALSSKFHCQSGRKVVPTGRLSQLHNKREDEFEKFPSISRERGLAVGITHRFQIYHDIHTWADFKPSCHMFRSPSFREITFETVKRFILLLFWLSKNYERCDVVFLISFKTVLTYNLHRARPGEITWNVSTESYHHPLPGALLVSLPRTWSWAVSAKVCQAAKDRA